MSKIVGRTLDFLEIFADQKRPLPSSEIARLLHIPASSCHDVLQELLDRGYIYELTARGGYYPTLRLYEIAKTIADHDPVPMRADAILKALRDKIDESILLAKVQGLEATYLLSIEPSHPLRFLANVGDKVRSLHATSAGKALLAGLDEPTLAAYLRSANLAALTPRTITSKTALREELVAGDRRGWFSNRDESQDGVTTVSARFMWTSASYIVTVAGPTSRLAPKLAKAADLLVGACKLLEAPPRFNP
jgi:DNA-binding IclR family transcriptional regulator